MEKENKQKIDSERMGSNYQKEAQAIARDLEDPAKRVEQTTPEHKPFPTQSSKRAAIRTYKDYAAQSLQKGGGSLTKMIISEREKKRETKRRSSKNPANVAIGVLSVILVVLGFAVVGGAFWLVSNTVEEVSTQAVLTPQPLILYDYRSEVYIPNLSRSKAVKEIKEKLAETSIEVGALKYLYFTTDNQFGAKVLLNADELLEGLRAKASGAFIRSVEDNFMYGVFSSVENAPFLILKTNNYGVTYAGMLEWERSLGFDLGELLGRGEGDYSQSAFVDVVYYNNDTRAILDTEGEVVLGYSFIDQETLVLFSDKLALREVVERTRENTVKK